MNALELKALEKHYPDFCLGPLDLTLPGGTICGLIGENGAGKSTTIRLILDILERDGGSIRVLGQENGADPQWLKSEVGVVLEGGGLPGTMNPVQIGRMMADIYPNWDAAAYQDYCRRFALPEKKPFGAFSRGMRMKQCIAVALSHHPKLLLLDEATSGLDPMVRDELLEVFADFASREDHAVLLSSHIVSDLEKICDYIAFLHRGKLKLCEEKDVLLDRYGLLKCTREALDQVDPAAVHGRRVTAYGAEALVERDRVPGGLLVERATLEDIILYLVKEETR